MTLTSARIELKLVLMRHHLRFLQWDKSDGDYFLKKVHGRKVMELTDENDAMAQIIESFVETTPLRAVKVGEPVSNGNFYIVLVIIHGAGFKFIFVTFCRPLRAQEPLPRLDLDQRGGATKKSSKQTAWPDNSTQSSVSHTITIRRRILFFFEYYQ